MSLKSQSQTMFAAIMAQYPQSVVAVVANGVTVSGVRDTRTNEADLAMAGEDGSKRGTIRVNADAVTIEKGQTITVGGTTCYVSQVRIDSAGALLTVDYTEIA